MDLIQGYDFAPPQPFMSGSPLGSSHDDVALFLEARYRRWHAASYPLAAQINAGYNLSVSTQYAAPTWSAAVPWDASDPRNPSTTHGATFSAAEVDCTGDWLASIPVKSAPSGSTWAAYQAALFASESWTGRWCVVRNGPSVSSTAAVQEMGRYGGLATGVGFAHWFSGRSFAVNAVTGRPRAMPTPDAFTPAGYFVDNWDGTFTHYPPGGADFLGDGYNPHDTLLATITIKDTSTFPETTVTTYDATVTTDSIGRINALVGEHTFSFAGSEWDLAGYIAWPAPPAGVDRTDADGSSYAFAQVTAAPLFALRYLAGSADLVALSAPLVTGKTSGFTLGGGRFLSNEDDDIYTGVSAAFVAPAAGAIIVRQVNGDVTTALTAEVRSVERYDYPGGWLLRWESAAEAWRYADLDARISGTAAVIPRFEEAGPGPVLRLTAVVGEVYTDADGGTFGAGGLVAVVCEGMFGPEPSWFAAWADYGRVPYRIPTMAGDSIVRPSDEPAGP